MDRGERGASIGASEGEIISEGRDVNVRVQFYRLDAAVFTRTHILRPQDPRSRHLSVMRLPRGEIRGVGNTGARPLAPEADSYHDVLPESLTGGVVFDAVSRGEIEA